MNNITTKEKILAAARKIFVKQGFAGTSIANIAKLAEVNHSLIFHHFGNKEQLWQAVKESIVADSQQHEKLLPETNLSLKDFIAKLVNNYFEFYQNNHDIIQLINWQRVEVNVGDEALKTGVSKEAELWKNAFKDYQQQGEINPKLKVEFVITIILSIISSAAIDPYIFISEKKAKKDYLKFCVDAMLKMLQT